MVSTSTDDGVVSPADPPDPQDEGAQRVGDTPVHDARTRASTVKARVVKAATTLRGVSLSDFSVDGLLDARLPSLRSLLDYTRAGGWVPGEHPPQAELPGKVYYYAVAIPGTALLYLLALILQRQLRFLVLSLVVILLVIFI